MTFDAQLLFLGTELIKLRQEQERAALIAQGQETLNGQIVGEGFEPQEGPAPDVTEVSSH